MNVVDSEWCELCFIKECEGSVRSTREGKEKKDATSEVDDEEVNNDEPGLPELNGEMID